MKKIIFVMSLCAATTLQTHALPLPHQASWPEAKDTVFVHQQPEKTVMTSSTSTPLPTTLLPPSPFSTSQPLGTLSSHEILVDALEVVSIFMIFAAIALIHIHVEKKAERKAALSQV